MPIRKRYPLEPLLQQREEQVDERARELHEKVDRTHRAEQTRQRAERERQEQELETRRLTHAEAARFDAGSAAVRDMMQLDAWRGVQAARAEALQAREQAAREQAHEAQHKEARARQDLAGARAQAKVIENHRERFTEKERKVQERRLEGEVEDGVNARFSRRRD